MILCPVCQAELKPCIFEDMDGEESHWTLQYGKRHEPAFYCPNALPGDKHGMNLWTETSTKNWIAMQKRLEKFKVRV